MSGIKLVKHEQKEKVSFQQELDNNKLYLSIEKVRFGERLDFVMNISERCEEHEIPNMILQPIIENAIKHGVYESIPMFG